MRLLNNCETCMQTSATIYRQSIGCGYEPPAPREVHVIVHVPRGWKHERPEVCPGYTTKLPEVIEVARARLHWSKGALAVALDGEPAHDMLLVGIELLESSSNECENLRMTPAKEGGLRE